MTKKKTTHKEDFSAKSIDELHAFVAETRNKVTNLNMTLSAKNPVEKRALRRSIARALTQIAAK